MAPGSVMAIARTIRTARPVPRASSAESPNSTATAKGTCQNSMANSARANQSGKWKLMSLTAALVPRGEWPSWNVTCADSRST